MSTSDTWQGNICFTRIKKCSVVSMCKASKTSPIKCSITYRIVSNCRWSRTNAWSHLVAGISMHIGIIDAEYQTSVGCGGVAQRTATLWQENVKFGIDQGTYQYTTMKPSFTMETAYLYFHFVYFVYFPAICIFAQVVPLWQLGSVQQLREHGDTWSLGFTHHNPGRVYRAS